MLTDHSPAANPHAYFWELAAQQERLDTRVTIEKKFFDRCLCVDGEPVAAYLAPTKTLVVKLTMLRVKALTEEGAGAVFTAMRKTFHEWAAVDHSHIDLWAGLVSESIDLARDNSPKG